MTFQRLQLQKDDFQILKNLILTLMRPKWYFVPTVCPVLAKRDAAAWPKYERPFALLYTRRTLSLADSIFCQGTGQMTF